MSEGPFLLIENGLICKADQVLELPALYFAWILREIRYWKQKNTEIVIKNCL